MNFSQRQRDPRQHLIGFAAVVLFHVLIVWALVSGLAKKVVDVVRAPIETKVIEEIKKPPPPPEIVVPPPPKLEAPPPPFIPPPEVQIATPPPPQPTITAVTPTPPPVQVEIKPAPPPPPAPAPVAAVAPPPAPPAPPPPKPVPLTIGAVCSVAPKPERPAVDAAFSAEITVSFTIQAGKVTKMDVIKQTFVPNVDRKVKRAAIATIEAAVAGYVCTGDYTDLQQTFSFKFD